MKRVSTKRICMKRGWASVLVRTWRALGDRQTLLSFAIQLLGCAVGGFGLGGAMRGAVPPVMAPMLMVPMFLAVVRQSRREAAACGLMFGLTFYATALQGLLGPWDGAFGGIWIVLTVVYALLHAAATLVASLLTRLGNRLWPVLPCAWVSYEFGRHLLTKGYDGCGLTFCLLGQSAVGHDQLRQSADLAGVWVLSFLIAAIGAAIASWISVDTSSRCSLRMTAGCAAVLAGLIAYGSVRQRPFERQVVGHAILISERLSTRGIDQAARLIDQHQHSGNQGGWWCVVTPETSITWSNDSLGVGRTADGAIQSGLLELTDDDRCIATVGAWVTDEASRSVRNASVVIRRGAVVAMVDKQQPVPFIERQPPGAVWLADQGLVPRWAVAEVTPQQDPPWRLWSEQAIPIVPCVCYDLFFPTTIRNYPLPESGAITCNLDETFDGNGIFVQLSRIHTQLRAVEFRRPVIRCSLGGLSGVWDSNGQAVAPQAAVAGVVLYEVPGDPRGSLYAQWGDWFPIACCMFTFTAFGRAILTGTVRPTTVGSAAAAGPDRDADDREPDHGG